MKIAATLLAACTAAALLPAVQAAPKPRWEIGIGGAATYSPAYYGSDETNFGGFPIVYFSYRGDDFSFLPNGLYDVASYDESRFGFGVSFDVTGNIDSEDRLNLGDIDTVLEAGPEVTVALYADGRQRIEASVAARVAYEFGGDFQGWVVEPKIAYLATLTNSTRVGIFAAPKFGFGDYNDFFYSRPAIGTAAAYDAEEGYLGTAVGLKFVTDASERVRISWEVKAITVKSSKIEDSPLVQEDWNYAARFAITYALWQSDEMVDQ